MPDIVNLEVELLAGGWSLDTQYEVLEYLKGVPKRFESEGARQACDEVKADSRR